MASSSISTSVHTDREHKSKEVSSTSIHYPATPAAYPVRRRRRTRAYDIRTSESEDSSGGDYETTDDDEETTEYDMTDIRTLVKERCPSLYKRFRPAWWLPK